jgi:hypothetical protein
MQKKILFYINKEINGKTDQREATEAVNLLRYGKTNPKIKNKSLLTY